jgi:hypothetical protein
MGALVSTRVMGWKGADPWRGTSSWTTTTSTLPLGSATGLGCMARGTLKQLQDPRHFAMLRERPEAPSNNFRILDTSRRSKEVGLTNRTRSSAYRQAWWGRLRVPSCLNTPAWGMTSIDPLEDCFLRQQGGRGMQHLGGREAMGGLGATAAYIYTLMCWVLI